MPVTRNTHSGVGQAQDYQVWTNADMVVGDILGIIESLGRAARTTTIEAFGGSCVVAFNVVAKAFYSHGTLGNDTTFGPYVTGRQSPMMADENEVLKPQIAVTNGIQTWRDGEIEVRDIKIHNLAPLTRITVS